MYKSEFNSELFREKYRTKSLRLSNYDYSSNGKYFVTICTKNMEEYFGEVRNYMMGLNEIGCIAAKFWQVIPKYFPFVRLDEWVVMPNHMHGIVIINHHHCSSSSRNAINRVSTTTTMMNNGGITGAHNPMGKKTLGEIIRWFKRRTSFEIHKNTNQNFQWQPRFYDCIIRSADKSLYEIRQYIHNNPEKWSLDRDNIN